MQKSRERAYTVKLIRSISDEEEEEEEEEKGVEALNEEPW